MRRGDIKVVVADSQVLTRQGMISIIEEADDMYVIAHASTKWDLLNNTAMHMPDVLLINYADEAFSLDDRL